MSSTLWRSRRRGERPVIYGRDRERAQLRELLDDAIAGHGSLVLISGEAGIGKTTLVDDLIHEARERDCLILTGGCYDLTTTPPYGPWSEAIRGYSPGDGDPLLPGWFSDPDKLEKVGSQAALFEEAAAFLIAVAAGQPLVVVLEDLHWSDDASLEALRYLARRLSGESVLLAVTYRDDEITRRHQLYQLLPILVRESRAERIYLNRLDINYTTALINRRYELSSSDRKRLAKYIWERSEGNPFFVDELLQGLIEEQMLQPAESGWQLGSLEQAHIPPLLRSVIERRLRRLDERTHSLLEIAAVIGQSTSYDLWAEISGANEKELATTVDAAVRTLLVREMSDRTGIEFRHALVREALYSGTIGVHLRSLHRHIARALEKRREPDPDRVFHHFELAGEAESGVDWIIRSGIRAERAFAPIRAVESFERALQLIGDKKNTKRISGWLHHRIGSILRFSRPDHALLYFTKAYEIAIDIDEVVLQAYAKWGRGSMRLAGGDFSQGFLENEEAGRALESLPMKARLHIDSGAHGNAIFSLETMPPDWFDEHGSFCLERATDTDDKPGHLLPMDATRRSVLASHYLILGYLSEAREHMVSVTDHDTDWTHIIRARVAAAEGRGHEALHDWKLAYANGSEIPGWTLGGSAEIVSLTLIPYFTDRVEDRRQLMTEHLSDSYLLEIWPDGWTPEIWFFEGRFLEGNWAISRDALDHVDLESGRIYYQHMARADLARLAYFQGDYQCVMDQVQFVLPNGPATEFGTFHFVSGPSLQRLASRLALERGKLDEACEWLRSHSSWIDWSGVIYGRSLGELGWARYHRVTGDLQPARKHAERAFDHASNPRQPLALIAADRFLGQLDVDEGKYDDAREHLEVSLELAEKCEAPFEQALTLVVMAERATKLGEVDEARRLIGRVREICEPLGAKPTLERVDEIEAMLPRTRRSTEEHPFGLTAREVEVLRLVARGRTDAEAAEEMFISPRTVSQHLRNAYNKIGVNNRAEATRVAVEEGIV